MLSSNFAVAVVTVVLRGLLERVLSVTPTPAASLVSVSTSFAVLSTVVFLLHRRFTKGRRLQVSYNPSNRKQKILDGRIHKKSSRPSSLNNMRSSWSPRRCRHRSRSRQCPLNLLQATKDSLEMLHKERLSASSSSSKSAASMQFLSKSSSVPRGIDEKERSPSLISLRSEPLEKREEVDDQKNRSAFGDCQWVHHHLKPPSKRRKRMCTTRKTRSGKIYSYL